MSRFERRHLRLWWTSILSAPAIVEVMVRDEAIGGSNPRAKQTGMQWVLRMHREEAMPFKGYTQSIVARLEDSDGNVRDTAKSVVIELFKDAPRSCKDGSQETAESILGETLY